MSETLTHYSIRAYTRGRAQSFSRLQDLDRCPAPPLSAAEHHQQLYESHAQPLTHARYAL
jgi:hypothetical protein